MRATVNMEKMRQYAISAIQLRNEGKLEDVLRHNLSMWMPQVFTDIPQWIQEHVYGTEEKVHFVSESGSNRGFIDSLVGKTAIEYEKNLTIKSTFEHGYNQVKDYCAGILNKGILAEDIIGVLSDTVHWYSYSIEIISEPNPSGLYGRNNLSLNEIEAIFLDQDTDISIIRLVDFLQKYLGRTGARQLSAKRLSRDMGLNSEFCNSYINIINEVINKAFTEKPHYADLIKNLWINFISYIGGNNSGFANASYVNEFYIISLAKFLCANIIEEKGLLSNDKQLLSILDGTYFKNKGYANLVEYDYFGWINHTPYAQDLIPVLRKIQEDLLVYDYKYISTEDLFGSLVAQLSQREQRILLGQEETPQWLASKMVERALELLPEGTFPRFIDMCCGSGVFIVETLKQTQKKYHISEDNREKGIQVLHEAILGFDIDPLAVMLSRVNWVIIMKKYVPYTSSELIIPIFHADSLFIKTPIAENIGSDYQTQLHKMNFGGKTILLPGFLLNQHNRRLFDYFMQSCYGMAEARANNDKSSLAELYIDPLINSIMKEISYDLNPEQIEELKNFGVELTTILEKLQRNGLNGIWPFILSNTYRPALVSRQFNGIVSNPPWLAMSKLKDNPYKNELNVRAEKLGIKPYGSSHLHVELATIFLMQSIEHYLGEDAFFACIIPESILKGYHHEPFRKLQYNIDNRKLDLNIDEIWEIDENTFKNKAIVLLGNNKRVSEVKDTFAGRIVSEMNSQVCSFKTIHQGKRSAWTSNMEAMDVSEVIEPIHFTQGADIMPRTVTFYHAVLQPNGRWSLSSIRKNNDNKSYLLENAHNNLSFTMDITNIHDNFMYKCYMSHHLTPFHLSDPEDVFIPLIKSDKEWLKPSIEQIVSMGANTNNAINLILNEVQLSLNKYRNKLNYRRKLEHQFFTKNSFLVVTGAGGSYPCAAFSPLNDNKMVDRIIIDQTLYWDVVTSEEEALYVVGLLNSKALACAISEFQPEGLQGKRHIHTLPFDITPKFDIENELHIEVVNRTRELITQINNQPLIYNYYNPNNGILRSRRTSIRNVINSLPAYNLYEQACSSVYS